MCVLKRGEPRGHEEGGGAEEIVEPVLAADAEDGAVAVRTHDNAANDKDCQAEAQLHVTAPHRKHPCPEAKGEKSEIIFFCFFFFFCKTMKEKKVKTREKQTDGPMGSRKKPALSRILISSCWPAVAEAVMPLRTVRPMAAATGDTASAAGTAPSRARIE